MSLHNTVRRALLGLLLSVLAGFGFGFEGTYDEVDSGVIERINFTTGTAVIGGLNYGMAPELTVEINDSYGAFTMLKRGMFVRVYYVEYADNDRRAVFIEEVTDPREWEET